RADADLASGGVMLLPDQLGRPPLAVATGKEGKIYLMNRDNMGRYQRCGATCDDVVQVTPGATVNNGSYGSPAYSNNRLYYQGANDILKAFQLESDGRIRLPAVSQTNPPPFGFTGSTPSISANGTNDGIAWALQVNAAGARGPAVLHAYNAMN